MDGIPDIDGTGTRSLYIISVPSSLPSFAKAKPKQRFQGVLRPPIAYARKDTELRSGVRSGVSSPYFAISQGY
jgi:hypothetical protein